MSEPLEITLGRFLRGRGWTLAVAETTTGGLISARIVAVPGSSVYYERGAIAYSKAAKVEMLGLDAAKMAEHGAVSAETARAMAEGIRRLSQATLGLAETGIAGPVAGRSPKPVGTAFVALSGPLQTHCRAFLFTGNRQAIRAQIAEAAIQFAVDHCRGSGISER